MLTPPITTLAIADDHVMVREALCSLIAQFGDFKVEIQASCGAELIHKLEQSAILPDICILDINMSKKNGWDTLTELKKRWPDLKVLVLTVLQDKHTIGNIVKNGANGYMHKNSTAHDLKISLVKMSEVGYYFPESIAPYVYNSWHGDKKDQPNKKEMEFLSHCCDDLGYKEIAQKMSVSPRTVEGYRDSLFEKLQINTRIGLAIYAIKNGFVSLFDQ